MHAQADFAVCSGRAQAVLRHAQECSPSAQVKAAAAHVQTLKQNQRKKKSSMTLVGILACLWLAKTTIKTTRLGGMSTTLQAQTDTRSNFLAHKISSWEKVGPLDLPGNALDYFGLRNYTDTLKQH